MFTYEPQGFILYPHYIHLVKKGMLGVHNEINYFIIIRFYYIAIKHLFDRL